MLLSYAKRLGDSRSFNPVLLGAAECKLVLQILFLTILSNKCYEAFSQCCQYSNSVTFPKIASRHAFPR